MNNWNSFPSVSDLFNVCIWVVAVFWLDLSLSLQLVSFQQNGASGKEPTCQCRDYKKHGFDPWVRKIPWKRAWQPTPVFLPGGAWWAPVLRLAVGNDWVTGQSMPQPLCNCFLSAKDFQLLVELHGIGNLLVPFIIPAWWWDRGLPVSTVPLQVTDW